jgi:hypothetical protein
MRSQIGNALSFLSRRQWRDNVASSQVQARGLAISSGFIAEHAVTDCPVHGEEAADTIRVKQIQRPRERKCASARIL